jgi:hypothetical protein
MIVNSLSYTNNISPLDSFVINPKNESKQKCEITIETLSKKANQIVSFSDKLWAYAGRGLALTRHVLNTTIKSAHLIALKGNSVEKIQKAVVGLKLFTIFSVPLSLVSLSTQVKKIWASIKRHDGEGVALSSLSIASLSTDAFDSVITFINALLIQLSITPIAWISTIGTPLGLTTVALGSVSRAIKLKNLSTFLKEIDQDLLKKMKSQDLSPEELKSLVEAFLKAKMEKLLNQENIKNDLKDTVKEFKKTVLDRQTSSDIVSLMDLLLKQVENPDSSDLQASLIKENLQRIVKTARREIGIHSGFLISNLINAVGLVLLYCPVLMALPFILLGITAVIRLGLQGYQDYQQAKLKEEIKLSS